VKISRALFLTFLSFSALYPAHAQENVCARVKIQIEQELTFERQAFEARLTIKNGLPETALTDFAVDLQFADAEGNSVIATTDASNTEAKFFYRFANDSSLPTQVAAGGEAKTVWLIVPAPEAGGEDPQGELYYVGANIRYKVAGVEEAFEVVPDYIYVKPMPLLELEYFLPEQVIGDDPQTLTVIEPAIAFTLGVRVKNVGAGEAKDLKIESSQPRIVENELGLAIEFHIQGSEVNGQPAQPTLLADFGDIGPGRVGSGRWIMTASLTGLFTDFTASFAHADEFGGEVTSLLESTTTYELVGDVRVDLPGRDAVGDFLARPRNGSALTLHESDALEPVGVTDLSGSATLTSVAPSQYRLAFQSAPPEAGFFYVALPDPFHGNRVITEVVRSDGKRMSLKNVWLTRFQDLNGGQWSYFLNLFDGNNSGAFSYLIEFGSADQSNQAPVLAVLGERYLQVGETASFLVTASDPNGDQVSLSAGLTPAGLTFADQGDGTGLISWRPTAAQVGEYSLTITASDGEAQSQRTMRLIVTTGSFFESWKDRYWPGITDPDIIGDFSDPDLDGLSNLVEYGLDLDPTQPSGEAIQIGVETGETGSYLTATYVKRTDDPALEFIVTGASTLQPGASWTAQTEALPVDQSDLPDGFERVRIIDSMQMETGSVRRFLRLEVVLNE